MYVYVYICIMERWIFYAIYNNGRKITNPNYMHRKISAIMKVFIYIIGAFAHDRMY